MSEAGTLAALHDCGHEDVEEPLSACDQALLSLARTEHAGAFLSLRCRSSWPLEEAVRGFHRDYHRAYGLELAEMASYALDDVGHRYPYAENGDSRPGRIPLPVQVVRSWDPGQSALPHWARRCLQYRNDFKYYLKEQGLLLIGAWALLADSSAKQVREALERSIGKTTLTVEGAVDLHRRYLPLYKAAKLQHRSRGGGQRGWQPDDAFLHQLEPHQPAADTRRILEEISTALRQMRTGQWKRDEQRLLSEGAADGLEGVAAPPSDPWTLDDGREEASGLEGKARQALNRAAKAYFQQMLSEIPAVERDQQLGFWTAWLQGLSTRDIAKHCGAAQAKVSRRLQVERRAREIATAALVQLRSDPGFAELFRSTERLDAATEGLVHHLLKPEQEGGEPPMRQMLRNCLETQALQP